MSRPSAVPVLPTRSTRAIDGFNEMVAERRALAAEGGPVGDLAEAALDRTGYVAEPTD